MPSSPDLPSVAELWKGTQHRSYSTGAFGAAYGSTSTSNLARAAPVKRAPSALLDKLDRIAAREFDPPPVPRFSAQEKGKAKAIVLDDDDDEEDPFDTMIKRTNEKQVATSKKLSASTAKRAHEDSEDSDFEGTLARIKPKKKAAKMSEEDKAAKKERAEQEKAAKKALAEKEKAAKKARAEEEKLAKNLVKEREAEEKNLLRKVNLLRNDKAETIKELTLHLAGTGLREPAEDDSTSGRNGRAKKKPSAWREIVAKLEKKMEDCECGFAISDDVAQDVAEGSLRWTRLCDRRWEQSRNEYVPLGPGNDITVEEDTRLVFITAYELSTHVASESFLSHIRSIKARLPSHINLFLMIHGLNNLYREMTKAGNAVFRADVRTDLGSGGGGPVKAKAVGIGEAQPSKETLEMAIMRAQIAMKCQIINTEDVENAVAWLHQLSMDVGGKPSHRHKMKDHMELGTGDEKIVSGKGLEDTYIKMLTSIKGLTDPVAKGIVREYPTLRCLYEAWNRCTSEKERQTMLVGIMKGNNVNGAATNRAIGATTSRTIYDVFTGSDPAVFL